MPSGPEPSRRTRGHASPDPHWDDVEIEITGQTVVLHVSCTSYQDSKAFEALPLNLNQRGKDNKIFNNLVKPAPIPGEYLRLFDEEVVLGVIHERVFQAGKLAGPEGRLILVFQGHGASRENMHSGVPSVVFVPHGADPRALPEGGLEIGTLFDWIHKLKWVNSVALIAHFCDSCELHRHKTWKTIKEEAKALGRARALLTVGRHNDDPVDGKYFPSLMTAWETQLTTEERFSLRSVVELAKDLSRGEHNPSIAEFDDNDISLWLP